MIMPSPGVSILSLYSLKPAPMPSEAILLSISRLLDCASDRCASRMQTASVPRSAWQVSTRSSPKKCDFPEPRPPKAPLYRTGWSSGSKTLAVGIFRVDNDALNLMDQFKGTVVGVLKRLRGLTPAAVENDVGGGDARGRGRILASHDADQHVDRRPGMAASQRADFGDGSFCHLLLVPIGLHAVALHKIGMFCRGAVRHRRAE